MAMKCTNVNSGVMNRIVDRLPSRYRLADLNFIKPSRQHGQGTWDDFKLHKGLKEGVLEMGLASPNVVQSLAIPKFVKSPVTSVLSAETGSGKTLSYLLPIMHKIKCQEGGDQPRGLKAAILVPSNELSVQVHAVSKKLSHSVKLRVERLAPVMTGHQIASLQSADLLIATPAKLESAFRRGLLKADSLSHLVIDEADTLLTGRFGMDLHKGLLEMIDIARLHTFVMCSATITVAMKSVVQELPVPVDWVTSRGLHRPIPTCRQSFRVVKLPEIGKQAFLAKLLRKHLSEKIMIFCNSVRSAALLHKHLSGDDGLAPMLLHGGIPEKQREHVMQLFSSGQGGKHLICTDLAARGVDVPGVDHVILFGCPQSVTDYLHRIGRTGRAGRPGRVTVLVGKRSKPLVQRLEVLLKRRLLRDPL